MKICLKNKQSRLSKVFISHSAAVAALGVVPWLLLNLLLVREANAQGTITFNNWAIGVHTHIYAPLTSIPLFSQFGNGPNDLPAGTTSWAGWPLVGASGTGGFCGGATTFAELLAAPGLNAPESSLLPATAGGITTFHTGTAGGIVVGTIATFNNIPPDFTGGATVEVVAWDNSSGLLPTWAQARAAWLSGVPGAYGSSGVFNLTAQIGGTMTPPNLLGLRSFNLMYTPEPSMLGLLGLGITTLLIPRRRR
jgi:hypothetical protein